MKTLAIVLQLAPWIALLAWGLRGLWKTYTWHRRIRSIREAATKEVERAGKAIRQRRTVAAELHLSRFRELAELHEEELRK